MNDKILEADDVKDLIKKVRTTQWSLIHSLFPVRDIVPETVQENPSSKGLFYCYNREFLGVPRCYLFLVITAMLPLLALIISAGFADTLFFLGQNGLRLPFIFDLNSIFTFLISYPTVIILLVIDDKRLSDALRRLVEQGILRFSSDQENIKTLLETWKSNYMKINIFGQFLGFIIGFIVAYVNYVIYKQKELGFWIVNICDSSGSLNPAGYVYLISIGLLYCFLTVYIVRILAHSVFLANFVKEANSTLHVLFLHPDRCGGLSPVGEIGLQNQIPITVFGVNIVLLIFVSYKYLCVECYPLLLDIIMTAIVAYSILGPLVFFAPLMVFRTAMRKKKDRILEHIARKSRKLEVIEHELECGHVTDDYKDQKTIEELLKTGKQVLDLPVWPFDIATIKKFVASYLIPFISEILSKVILHYLAK